MLSAGLHCKSAVSLTSTSREETRLKKPYDEEEEEDEDSDKMVTQCFSQCQKDLRKDNRTTC